MTKPEEEVEVEPINPVVPNPRDLELPDPLEREVNMDQHKLDERARELIKRGEYNVVLLPCGSLSLNPFIEYRIQNKSSSSDVLYIQASISISSKYESK